jgi:hypothetical protein
MLKRKRLQKFTFAQQSVANDTSATIAACNWATIAWLGAGAYQSRPLTHNKQPRESLAAASTLDCEGIAAVECGRIKNQTA